MRVGVTGASGLIGKRLVAALTGRGDSVIALSRDPSRARERVGVEAVAWNPAAGPAPAETLAELDAVVNLAGEPIAQRWSSAAKERIRSSRVTGTENLIAGLRDASPRPGLLVSASAAGYYGDRGSAELDESAGRGTDFLAAVTADWEAAADRASSELGMRVAKVRTGVVLDRAGGALEKMLPAFKAGVGGPIAGGRQYVAWVGLDDVVGIYVAALSDAAWSGPVNASGPAPVTNGEFSHALGRILHRPSFFPVPGFAIRLMFGEMSSVVTASQRMVPARALELGYQFRYRELETALQAALS